jgi:hypothetical protein
LDRLGVTNNLRRIIARTALEFENTGNWVSYNTLVYETAEGEGPYDLNEIFQLPGSIGGVWTSEEKVSLTGLGLILSEAAPECSHMMVAIVRICVERKLRLRDDAKLGRAILVSEHGYSDAKAQRAMDLFQLLPGVSGGGQLGENWELSIFRTVLTDYRDVRTIHDLRAVLERQALDRLQLHQQTMANPPAFVAEGSFADSFRPPSAFEFTDVVPLEQPIVFLSWGGTASRAIAAVLHGILQRRLPSCEVFFSPVSIDPGEDPMLEIFERNLLRAQTLIAVLTEEASRSAWVTWEIASAWARKDLVVPLFVDVKPDDIPGPISLKIQGMRLGDRVEVDRAVFTVMKQAGFHDENELTDEEWDSLTAAGTVIQPVTVFPANFNQRVVPLHDGIVAGTLLALLISAEAALDDCKCMLTAITGPTGVEAIPVPATLPWHPSKEAVIDVAHGATELICIARVGPSPPSALIDSTNQALPWGLAEGAWRLELQLTAKGHVAQLISAVITVAASAGIPSHTIEWTELTVH